MEGWRGFGVGETDVPDQLDVYSLKLAYRLTIQPTDSDQEQLFPDNQKARTETKQFPKARAFIHKGAD